jgi:hypothetical protein
MLQPRNVEAAMVLLSFAAADHKALSTLVLHAPMPPGAANGAVQPAQQHVGGLVGQWGAGLQEWARCCWL